MKKFVIVLLAALIVLCFCGCAPAASGSSDAERDGTTSGSQAGGAAALQESLPVFSADENGNTMLEINGQSFTLPQDSATFLSLLSNKNDISGAELESIPPLPCEIPETLTEDMLSQFTKLDEPSLPSVFTASYTNEDGSIRIDTEAFNVLGDCNNIYKIRDDNGNDLLYAYYSAETGELNYVEVFLGAIEEINSEEDSAYFFNNTRTYRYHNGGEMWLLRNDISSRYLKNECSQCYAIEVVYDVSGDILTLDEYCTYCSFLASDETGEKTTLLYLNFDGSDQLSSISFYSTVAIDTLTYELSDSSWYDREGNPITFE